MPKTLKIFDPPMCCATGACGPQADPELLRFASDLEWLKQQGVMVERYNLSGHPGVFADTASVREALQKDGNTCLPLFVIEGVVVHRGSYPARTQMANWVGIVVSADPASAPVPAAACCAPGCGCGSTGGPSRLLKFAMCGLVVVAVAGILIYKMTRNPQEQKPGTGFSALTTAVQPARTSVEVPTASSGASTATPITTLFGSPLKSFADLKTQADAYDAVCIFGASGQA